MAEDNPPAPPAPEDLDVRLTELSNAAQEYARAAEAYGRAAQALGQAAYAVHGNPEIMESLRPFCVCICGVPPVLPVREPDAASETPADET